MSTYALLGANVVLCTIFEHLSTEDGSLEAAVQVCKLWRGVGDAFGSLWTVFDLRLAGGAPRNLATILARSRGHPVDLTVSFGMVTTAGSPDDHKTRLYHAHALKALSHHLPHTRRLALRTAPGIVLPPTPVTDLLQSRAEVLEFLHWDLAFPPVLPHNVFQCAARRLLVVEARPSQFRCVRPKCSCAVHTIGRRLTHFSPLHYGAGLHLGQLCRTFEKLQTLSLGAPVPITVERTPEIVALGKKLGRLVIFDSPEVSFASTLLLFDHPAVKAITVYKATSQTVNVLRQPFYELQLDPASNRNIILARTREGLERLFVVDDDPASIVRKSLLRAPVVVGLQRLTVKSSSFCSRRWHRVLKVLAQSSISNLHVLLKHLTIVLHGDTDDSLPHLRSIQPHERVPMHELDTLRLSKPLRFDDMKHELVEEPNTMRWMYGEDLKKIYDKAIETKAGVFRRLELHGVQFRPTARCPLSQISRNLEHVHPPGPRAVKIRVVKV